LQEKDVIEVRCRVAQSSYGDSREPSSNVSRRDGKQVQSFVGAYSMLLQFGK
jgi:hypothetical protein